MSGAARPGSVVFGPLNQPATLRSDNVKYQSPPTRASAGILARSHRARHARDHAGSSVTPGRHSARAGEREGSTEGCAEPVFVVKLGDCAKWRVVDERPQWVLWVDFP